MTARSSARYSPPPRNNAPPGSNSHGPQPRNSYQPQTGRERFRDRPSQSRHYPEYDDYDYEFEQSGGSSNFRPPNLQLPPRPARKQTTPPKNGQDASHHQELPSGAVTTGSSDTPMPDVNASISWPNETTKNCEELISQFLESITDVSCLKAENNKATLRLDLCKERYNKNICHHSKFPNLKITLQNEVERAKEIVDQIDERLVQRDSMLRKLAKQLIPVLIPAATAPSIKDSKDSEEIMLFERSEKSIANVQQQFLELQRELSQISNERTSKESFMEKQIAQQSEKMLEIIKSDLARQKELTEVKAQLRTLNNEISVLKQDTTTSRKEIKAYNKIADGAVKNCSTLEKRLVQIDQKFQGKVEQIEDKIEPIQSFKTSINNLQEKIDSSSKASEVDKISAALKDTVDRIDLLPNTASYSTLSSKIETLEKEKVPKSLLNQISNQILNQITNQLSKQISTLAGQDIPNRLKVLENKASVEIESQSLNRSDIMAMEEKMESISKLMATNASVQVKHDELSSVRTTTEELQKTLTTVQAKLTILQERSPEMPLAGILDASSEKFVETKIMKFLEDPSKKIKELCELFAATNHSLGNLTARVNNISTGHLAQAILGRLSETYPHIQNVEQLYVSHGVKLREIESRLDSLGNQEAIDGQSALSNLNAIKHLNLEVEKIWADVLNANSNIMKLASATDEDRRYISEKLTTRLDSLVDSSDLNNHKNELFYQVKGLVERGIEEFSKKIIAPQLNKLSKTSTLDASLEASLETRIKTRVSETLLENETALFAKIEDDIAALKDILEAQMQKDLQDQKKELEELVIAQVDRSLVSKRSDLVKELSRRVDTKIFIEEPRASPAIGRSTPVSTPTLISSKTRRQSCDSSISNEVSKSSSTNKHAAENSIQDSQSSRSKKRKLQNARSSKLSCLRGNSIPALKKVASTPTAASERKMRSETQPDDNTTDKAKHKKKE